MSYKPDFYFYVKLTLANKENASDTLTLYIGNRAAYGETSLTIYDALQNVSGLDSSTSGGVPRVGNGRIDINNARGLFGANRRFVDFLDKYTLIYQDVEFYTAKVAVDGAVSGAATKRWVDKVLRVDARDDRVTLYLRTDLIPDREVCTIINNSLYADAPSESIGKAVPLILGSNQQVKPLMIKDDGNSSEFAYGTTYGSHFVNEGVQKYYARDYEGDYTEIKPISADYTDKNDQILGLYAFDDAAVSTGRYALPAGTGGVAKTIDHTAIATDYLDGELPSDYTYIITSYRIEVYKQSGAPSDEVLTVKIWEKDPNTDLPGRVVGDGGIVESSVLSTGYSKVAQHFKRPVILKPNKTYYFGFYTNYLDTSTGTATKRLEYQLGSLAMDPIEYRQDEGEGTGTGDWTSGVTGKAIQVSLYAADWSETTSPSASYIGDNGRGVSYYTFDCLAPSIPDVRTVDMVIEANGLKDTSGGGVTGSSNKLLDEPHHALDALMYTWNGSTWAAGGFNSTTYSATHSQIASTATGWNFRKLGGSTRGKATLRQLCSEICQETLTYLTRVEDESGTALYAYGSEISTSGIVTDKDIIGDVSFNVDSRLSTVNIARASYNRKLTETDFDDVISQGGELSYSDFLEYRYDDAGLGQLYASECKELFDEVENQRRVYNWISDSTSASNILQLVMSLSDLPTEIASFRVQDDRFSSLKLWDVIELHTPQLPQYSGTNPAALAPVYNGSEQTVLEGDDQIALAKTYRAQIISIKNDFSNTAPMRELTVRLLINKADPT